MKGLGKLRKGIANFFPNESEEAPNAGGVKVGEGVGGLGNFN